ncbi:hypothetical protein [Mycobacterium sp.]
MNGTPNYATKDEKTTALTLYIFPTPVEIQRTKYRFPEHFLPT